MNDWGEAPLNLFPLLGIPISNDLPDRWKWVISDITAVRSENLLSSMQGAAVHTVLFGGTLTRRRRRPSERFCARAHRRHRRRRRATRGEPSARVSVYTGRRPDDVSVCRCPCASVRRADDPLPG